MTLWHALIILVAGVYLHNHERADSFINDCLGMSVDYTVKKWPELSEKVLARSSKTVRDLYKRAKKKRGDVA
jgi:hypothetical protein